ncbi:hypothetical protein B7494_g7805 [Chlorociboria aeruginascens]|nr:hypothetical protein B7494_g7805 [Chlorociboria aeruginascens]
MKKSSETIESKYTALQQKLTAIMQMVTSTNAPSTSNDNNTCPPQGLAERVQGILEDPKISPKPESPQPKAQIIKVRGASIIIAPAEVTDSADTPPLTLADLEKNIEQLFKDQQDATALLSRIRNTVDTVGKDLNLGAGAATPPEDFINLLAAKLGESQKGIAFLDEGSWQVAKSLSNALRETGQEEPSSYGTFDGLLGGIDNLKGAALTAQKNQASMSERVNNAIKGAIMGTGLVCTPEEFFPKIVTEVGNLKKKAEDRDHLNSKIQTLEASHKAEKDGLVSKMENLEASHKAEKAGLVGKIQTLEASHKAETDRLNGKIQTNLATPPILTNNPPAVPARPPFQASFTSTTSGQQRNAPPQGWIPEDDRVPKVDMGRLINPTKKKAFSGPILGGPIRRNPPSVGFNLTLPTGGVSTPPLPKTTTSTMVTEDEINEHRIKMARIYQLEARLINAKVLEEESDELGNALDSGRDMHCSRRVRHNLQMDHMSRRIPELESMYRDEVTVNLPAFPVNGRRQFADIFDQVDQRLAVDHENVPDDQRTRPQGWAKDDPRGKSKRSMED